MRLLTVLITVLFSISSFALPTFNPQLVLKNQFGEVSNNAILAGSQFSSFIFSTQTVSAAGALSTVIPESLITNASGSTFAVTLAAPSNQDGQIKVIKAVTSMAHTITLAMTNISMSGGYTPTGTTTLTFTNVGDSAVFMAVGSKWVYLGGSAVAS